METGPPSLESKIAYFTQLDALAEGKGRWEDGDAFDARERRRRQLHQRFFLRSGAGKKYTAAPALTRHQSLPEKQGRKEKETAKETPDAHTHTPRRVTSAPQPESESAQIVRGTQSGVVKRRGRLGGLLHPEVDVVQETPVAGSTQRVDDTPLSVPKRPSEDSPSVAMAMKKRKKQNSEPKMRPEEEQIFKGLSFYYLPDNDIAPARRLRITRAREFGVTWTRHVETATHIVVDKQLSYVEVEKMLLKEGGLVRKLKVVNEDYPIDCIQFRTMVDPGQRKYLLTGQPQEELDETHNASDSPPLSSEEPMNSLQLKPHQRNKRSRDYVPQKETPSQSEESSHRAHGVPPIQTQESQAVVFDDLEVVESPTEVIGIDELRRWAGEGDYPVKTSSIGKDELSEYISVMQEFKDLPLDEDDLESVVARSDMLSDVDERHDSQDAGLKKRRPKKSSRFSRKEIAFEDRFACNRAGEKTANENNPNARTIEILEAMSTYYEHVNDQWRTIAYRKAINVLKRQNVKVSTEEEAFKLPSIGQRLAQKIEEIVTTDKLKRLEYAQNEPHHQSLRIFLNIYGVGNKQAEKWIAQGFRTLDDIRQRATLTPNQLVGVEHYDDINTKIPRREVVMLGEVVKKAASRIDNKVQLIVGGSYRRGAQSSNDIDFIVTKPGTSSSLELKTFLDDLTHRLELDAFLVARLASSRHGGDGSKWHGCCVLPKIKGFNDEDYKPTWRRIDFLLVPETEIGAALIYFTGNDIFNRSMRLLASKKGMRLNQRGLYKDVMRGEGGIKASEGELVEGADERKIFEILGVKWREPHERWC